MLAPRPSRLCVERVLDAVFVVTVSSHRFADALALVGVLRIADVQLSFHPSLTSARRAVYRLPPFSPTVDGHVQTGRSHVNATGVPSSNDFNTADPVFPPAFEAIRLGSVPVNFLTVPAIPLSPVAGSGGAAQRLVATTAAAMAEPPAPGFNAQRPRSYVEAARSPLALQPPVLKRLKTMCSGYCIPVRHVV
jgi:hypothetical protein